MDEFAIKFADFLENTTTKVREMTVDRISRVLKIAALGLVAATLGLIAVVYLFISIIRALAVPLSAAGAFAVVGGLFLAGGAFMWWKRTREPEEN
ncbi:MAG: phage holin family protein [Acidimicrobiia bacterium]|nr:phage holin family protein [Acidimicrobiia bacterium]